MTRFSRSVSAEFSKVGSTKLWWILALVLFGYTALMAVTFGFLFSTIADQTGQMTSDESAQSTVDLVYSTVSAFGYVIPLLFGSLMATGEFRHHTLALAFTLEPKRGVVLSAKLTVAIVVGVLLGVIGAVGAVGPGALVLTAGDLDPMLHTPETWALVGRAIVAIGLWAFIGFGVGVVLKSQVFAIILALVFTQFLEPMLRIAAPFWEWSSEVAKYLPGAATDAFVGSSALSMFASFGSGGGQGDGSLPTWGGLLVLLAYGAVFVLLGWLTRWRADVEA